MKVLDRFEFIRLLVRTPETGSVSAAARLVVVDIEVGVADKPHYIVLSSGSWPLIVDDQDAPRVTLAIELAAFRHGCASGEARGESALTTLRHAEEHRENRRII
jgi:hypothetical protein